MNITIVEKQIPTLAPLGVARSCSELKLCGKSWRKLVRRRWLDALGKDSELTLTAQLNFWPSVELLEKLRKCVNGFRVVDAGGNVVAEGSAAPYRNALGLSVNSVDGKAQGGRKGQPVAEFTMEESGRMLLYPWDLLEVQEEVLGAAPHGTINGTINEGSVIDGNLDLGDGSMILPGVYITGNVVIGRNCLIGPNCCIRGTTAIGDGCRIGQGAEIKNSIIMDHVRISHVSYIGDSIVASGSDIGAGTMAANFRHDGQNIHSMVGNELVDTKRDHFGTIIGEDVHTGVNTSIYPGRKLAAGVCTIPGEIVKVDKR